MLVYQMWGRTKLFGLIYMYFIELRNMGNKTKHIF